MMRGAVACFLVLFGAVPFAACSSISAQDSTGSKDGWTCFKTQDEKEPCQCQTTPVGGKQEIIDRCGPELVQAGSEAECCKDWLYLNGKRQVAYYCSCYVKGERTCNASIGDELVDSCP